MGETLPADAAGAAGGYMARRASRFSTRTRQIFYIVLAAAVFLAASALVLFRDRLFKGGEDRGGTERWSYDTGSGQVFAPLGNGLAVASSTGFQLLDGGGDTVADKVFAIGSPALSAAADRVAVWDVGGREIRVFDADGEMSLVEAEKDVISVSLSDSGHMAVCSEESGYKGVVTVYDRELTPVYQWHSGSGYLIGAAVSPDGGRLAAMTVSAQGGGVHMFSLDSEEERGCFTAPQELLVDIYWLREGELCALSESRAVFLDSAAVQTGEFGYGGMYLTGRAFSSGGFAVLALSEYISGGTDVLVSVGGGGRELGRTEPEGQVRYLSANGRSVAALYSGSVALYDQSLARKDRGEGLSGIRAAIVRDRGDAILAGAYQAELFG